MRRNQSPLRKLAGKAIKSGESWLLNAHINATEESQVAGLYVLSIFEQFQATLCLLDRGLGMHCSCQIRSMLEHLTDLINVLKTPDYCRQLQKESVHSDDKIITHFKKLLAGEPPDEPIRQEVDQLLTAIQARDKQREQQRSAKIGDTQQDELPFLYTLLCGMTHPNLTSLRARHLQSDGSPAYCRSPGPDIYNMLLRIAIRLLIMTIRQLPSFTDCDLVEVSGFADSVDVESVQLQNTAQGS